MGFNFSSRPNRRYLLRLGTSMAVVLVALAVARYLTANDLVDGPLVWVLALIPGLAMLGAFYAFAMLIIEQDDEFIRMLVVRQWIIGTAFALSIATVWGFLEEFGLVPHLKPLYIVVMWFAGFALGGLINRLTHGAWGEMG